MTTILEQGNGFCDVGDYVTYNGILYRVVHIERHIHTGSAGAPNYVYGEVEPAEWDDITDEQADDIICTVCVDDGTRIEP